MSFIDYEATFAGCTTPEEALLRLKFVERYYEYSLGDDVRVRVNARCGVNMHLVTFFVYDGRYGRFIEVRRLVMKAARLRALVHASCCYCMRTAEAATERDRAANERLLQRVRETATKCHCHADGPQRCSSPSMK